MRTFTMFVNISDRYLNREEFVDACKDPDNAPRNKVAHKIDFTIPELDPGFSEIETIELARAIGWGKAFIAGYSRDETYRTLCDTAFNIFYAA